MLYPTKERFLETLFREMARRGDFPAISESVWRIVAVLDRNEEEFNLTQAILDDAALTQKVLTAANSAMYARFGQNITTITQAVVVLGYDKIGHLALGLKLANELLMAAKVRDARAQQALNQCTLTGTLSRHLARKIYAPNAEEVGVCGLLHGIGRVLVMFYMPDVWDKVESYIVDRGVTENDAVLALLGLAPGELGQEVAKYWRLPETVIKVLGTGEERSHKPLDTAPDHAEWLALMVRAACRINEKLAECHYRPTEAELRELGKQHADLLGLTPADLKDAVSNALAEEANNPLVGHGRSAERVVEPAKLRRAPDALRQLHLLRTTLRTEARKHSTRSLLGMTMESLHRIFGSRRIVLLLKEPAGRMLRARTAVGWHVNVLLDRFKLEADYAPDAFHLAIAKNFPLLVTNPKPLREGGRLPQEYVQLVKDDSPFMVLPMNIQGDPLGLMYLDWDPDAEAPTLSDDEKACLIAIRDILVETLEARRAQAHSSKDLMVA